MNVVTTAPPDQSTWPLGDHATYVSLEVIESQSTAADYDYAFGKIMFQEVRRLDIDPLR
jgi:hypothetical protein